MAIKKPVRTERLTDKDVKDLRAMGHRITFTRDVGRLEVTPVGDRFHHVIYKRAHHVRPGFKPVLVEVIIFDRTTDSATDSAIITKEQP